jgi:hypothetical protein
VGGVDTGVDDVDGGGGTGGGVIDVWGGHARLVRDASETPWGAGLRGEGLLGEALVDDAGVLEVGSIHLGVELDVGDLSCDQHIYLFMSGLENSTHLRGIGNLLDGGGISSDGVTLEVSDLIGSGQATGGKVTLSLSNQAVDGLQVAGNGGGSHILLVDDNVAVGDDVGSSWVAHLVVVHAGSGSGEDGGQRERGHTGDAGEVGNHGD